MKDLTSYSNLSARNFRKDFVCHFQVSNTYDGAFCENSSQLSEVDYFCRKLNRRRLTVF